MACFDTEANQRTKFTKTTLEGLITTVDLTQHRLIIVDNNSCQATKDVIIDVIGSNPDLSIRCIILPENLGTAEGLNRAWKDRSPGEHVIKIDNDVLIHESGWVDKLVEAADRDPKLGLVALKRSDLGESPFQGNQWGRTSVKMLPAPTGPGTWIVLEVPNDGLNCHIMGTCLLHTSNLLDKVGGMCQPGLYGWDDKLFAVRSHLAGFYNAFYPNIRISHIDDGSNQYQKEKGVIAGEGMKVLQEWINGYVNGTKSLYHKII